MLLTEINQYPVKSMKGVSHTTSLVDHFGIKDDRRWMLVDQQGRFITQRKHPLLSTISVSKNDSSLIFTTLNGEVLSVNADCLTRQIDVTVWGDTVSACCADQFVGEWFSSLLGLPVHLVYMPETTFRQVDRQFADYEQRVSFVDGFPFLLISESSLTDLNQRLENTVSMARFRPNLVVSGCDAYAEDDWRRIRIGQLEFEVVKPCSRCIMITLDERTLTYGKEPLKTLASYRRNEFGACFGQNLVHQSTGVLTVGDRVEVLE